jgi:hypothetical protein
MYTYINKYLKRRSFQITKLLIFFLILAHNLYTPDIQFPKNLKSFITNLIKSIVNQISTNFSSDEIVIDNDTPVPLNSKTNNLFPNDIKLHYNLILPDFYQIYSNFYVKSQVFSESNINQSYSYLNTKNNFIPNIVKFQEFISRHFTIDFKIKNYGLGNQNKFINSYESDLKSKKSSENEKYCSKLFKVYNLKQVDKLEILKSLEFKSLIDDVKLKYILLAKDPESVITSFNKIIELNKLSKTLDSYKTKIEVLYRSQNPNHKHIRYFLDKYYDIHKDINILSEILHINNETIITKSFNRNFYYPYIVLDIQFLS